MVPQGSRRDVGQTDKEEDALGTGVASIDPEIKQQSVVWGTWGPWRKNLALKKILQKAKLLRKAGGSGSSLGPLQFSNHFFLTIKVTPNMHC